MLKKMNAIRCCLFCLNVCSIKQYRAFFQVVSFLFIGVPCLKGDVGMFLTLFCIVLIPISRNCLINRI